MSKLTLVLSLSCSLSLFFSPARYILRLPYSTNSCPLQRQQQEFDYLQQQQQRQQNLLIEQQKSEQQWQFQQAMLLNDLQEIEEKMQEVTAIKSPYSGSVRRVKIIQQNERTIQVEISLVQ